MEDFHVGIVSVSGIVVYDIETLRRAKQNNSDGPCCGRSSRTPYREAQSPGTLYREQPPLELRFHLKIGRLQRRHFLCMGGSTSGIFLFLRFTEILRFLQSNPFFLAAQLCNSKELPPCIVPSLPLPSPPHARSPNIHGELEAISVVSLPAAHPATLFSELAADFPAPIL